MEKITDNKIIDTINGDAIEHAKDQDLSMINEDCESFEQSEFVNGLSRVGSVVSVEQDGDLNKFRLVEEHDLVNSADDDVMRISVAAPAGKALLGIKAGDTVEYTTHSGKTFFITVIDVI